MTSGTSSLALKGYLEISKEYAADAAKMSEFIGKEEQVANTIERQITFTKEYEGHLGVHAPVWHDCRTLVDTAVTQVSLGKVLAKNVFLRVLKFLRILSSSRSFITWWRMRCGMAGKLRPSGFPCRMPVIYLSLSARTMVTGLQETKKRRSSNGGSERTRDLVSSLPEKFFRLRV